MPEFRADPKADLPRTVPERDLFVAELAGVSEGRVMDLVTGAALMLAAQRDTMIATMGFLDLPADMRLVLKASMDAAEQLMHSLDHGVTDNLNEGELSNYLAFFDRMLDCLEREHQIRGELPCRSCGLIGCESCV